MVFKRRYSNISVVMVNTSMTIAFIQYKSESISINTSFKIFAHSYYINFNNYIYSFYKICASQQFSQERRGIVPLVRTSRHEAIHRISSARSSIPDLKPLVRIRPYQTLADRQNQFITVPV